MDPNGENVGRRKFRKTECSLCDNPASKLFRFPSKDGMYKKWFSLLKWDVPPERLKYVLDNARVCDRHFAEWCFTSTLRQKLIKFACPFTNGDDIASNQILSALPSATSQTTSVEVCDTEPYSTTEVCDTEPYSTTEVCDTEPCSTTKICDIAPCSATELCSPTSSHDTIHHLQVTLKTRKIKSLRCSVSKLKKKLYEKHFSSRFLGQLKAKFADKPHLYNFVTSQLKLQSKDSKGRRWSAKEKSFTLPIYLHSPSAYKLLRKFFAFPSKATLCRMADAASARGRGGFRGGFGRGGRGGWGRGRGRGRGRGHGRGKEEKEWVPVTKLGRLVKDGKIKSLEEIYLFSLPIKECEIIDFFLGSNLKDDVMKIMPVQKQTRAGQRTRFKAIVAMGDNNGHVGLGVKCSKEVATAVRGAIMLAKLTIIPVRRGYWGNRIGSPHTVPCQVTGKCGSVVMRLIPAPRGTGIVSAPVPKKLLTMAGIEDCYTSARGSTATLGNFAKATYLAIQKTYSYTTTNLWKDQALVKPYQEYSDYLMMTHRTLGVSARQEHVVA